MCVPLRNAGPSATAVSYTFDAATLAGEVERLTSGGDSTLTVNGESLPVETTILSGNQTISADTDYGDATQDDRMTVVKVNGNYTIDATYTVSVTDRKLGLCLYVDGDLTVNGTIDMSARGGNHSAATGSNIAAFALQCVGGIGNDGIVPAAGATGGTGGVGTDGNTGGAGINGGTGGGGGGAGYVGGTGGNGAAGTGFSGGPGGGGSRGAGTGQEGGIDGGKGGDGYGTGFGGAGNPLGSPSANGTNGTGGILIVICTGNITIGATGIISSNGSIGATQASDKAGGGGSGGGSISLYHNGTYTNSGTVVANGGAGGDEATGKDGGAGGAGDIRVSKISALTTLKDSLVSWWTLDETSGTRADSHGSNDLTDNNTVLYRMGKQGYAADFEDTNSENLSIADNASLSFANESFSLAAWVKLESSPSAGTIIGKDDYGTPAREYSLVYLSAGTQFAFVISPDGTTTASVAVGSISTATWYFVVAWHDADADTINIQVNNGAIQSTAHSTGCNDGAASFRIGARMNGASPAQFFDGLIDEAALWNRVLTEEEKTWLYNSGFGKAYGGLP